MSMTKTPFYSDTLDFVFFKIATTCLSQNYIETKTTALKFNMSKFKASYV